MITKRFICMALNAALCASTAGLVGCNQQPTSAVPPPPASAASTAPAVAESSAPAQAYTPPTAKQMYQLVAPIALFPDKLVAQVLAGSTYPDQVTAADTYLAQNPGAQGGALQDQVDQQSWDPSIKGLTAFPKVLDQMAQNMPWTSSLGEAYVNDPTDVLNAIQVMRQRASKHGSLSNSAQLRVVEQPIAQDASYAEPTDGNPPVYAGPDVVPPPPQEIEILPAQTDTVYVPQYDPQTVYGDEQPVYPGYSYEQPQYSTGEVVAAGAIVFGVGIVVGSLFEHSHHHDRPSYGWNSWGMNWGGRRSGDEGHDGGYGGGRQRPAVVHNNTTYVSKSTTIVNRYVTNNTTNNINNSVRTINSNNSHSGNTISSSYTNNSVHNSNNTRNMLAPAYTPAAVRRAELERSSAAPAAQAIKAPDFRGALSKGEPARFSRPGEPEKILPRAQPASRVQAHATSEDTPRFAQHLTAPPHPVRSVAPIETARPRFSPPSDAARHPVQPASQRAALPPRAPRTLERAMPPPRREAPGSAAPRAQAEFEHPYASPHAQAAQPPREAPHVQVASPLREAPHVHAAPPPRETPHAQTSPHEQPRQPVAAPKKAVSTDARQHEKKSDQGR